MAEIKLSESQQRAWDLLKEGKSVLLFGKGGTGKTFLQNLWKKQNPKCDAQYIDEPLFDWRIMVSGGPIPANAKYKKSVTVHLTKEERKELLDSIPQRLYVTDCEYSAKWDKYLRDNLLTPVILVERMC